MIKTGDTLNNTYEILDRIGSGGGGIIYKAYHRRMRKYVAIKLIKENIKGEFRNRAEVDVLKDLKNDFLPQVLDFVEDGEDVYTVMEFVEGQNFKQLISSGREFTEEQVIKYAIQLCEAVEYLHSQNPPIIHSDIKPANIMLTPQDNICLIDFNISLVSENGIATSKGGSRDFGAPEQFKRIINAPEKNDSFHEETRFLDEQDTEILVEHDTANSINSSLMKTKNITRAFIDVRTDIYGIGASIYYILTSRIPSGGKLDFRGIRCSTLIKEIITRAMNQNPAKRYSNVKIMKAALKRKSGQFPIICSVAVMALFGIVIGISTVTNSKNIDLSNSDEIQINEGVFSEIISSTNITDESSYTSINVTDVAITDEKTTNETENAEDNVIIVPDLNNLTKDQATNMCDSLGLNYKVIESENTSVPSGYVVNQQTPAGTKIEKNSVIVFTVSVAKAVPNEINTVKFITIKGEQYSTSLTELDLSGIYLTNNDIKELDKMINLKSLKIGGYEDFEKGSNDVIETQRTPINNISVISNLTNLTQLDLSWNEIRDLSPLSQLHNLTTLHLDYNLISDITPLENLTNLNELSLHSNRIENISSLASLRKLSYLDLVDNQVSDINPLGNLTNLTYLNLFFNQISDISPLKHLTNLKEVNLETNKISDLSPLSNNKNIIKLNLESNQISDITPLSGLTNLQHLNLDNNKISNIDAIRLLTNLTELSFYKNEIENIKPLESLTNLEKLNLNINKISDLTPLKNLTKLNDLNLYSNQITDISPLSNLSNLKNLSLGNNNIIDISPLKKISSLKYVDLCSNPTTDESITELEEALPNCYVWVL